MIEIIPSLLPQNLHHVEEQFGRILGLVKKVQVDIVDGEYAPNKTWPFNVKDNDDILNMVRGEASFPHINSFLMELDMLILHPIEYIPDFLSVGFKSFVIHIDSTDHVKECIKTIKNAGCKVGLGIKPKIPTTELEPYITEIDFVQFMGNDQVGRSGIELDQNVADKIAEFKKHHPSFDIQIDIGVNFETAPLLAHAGATALISNSTIFNSKDPKEVIMKLQKS